MNTERRHTVVRELFVQALALPGDTRAAFLQQACGDDLGLRAEVEVLLAGRASPPPEGVVTLPVTDLFDWPSQAAPESDDPAVIGRYRVIRLLGRGGFGLVYLAHDDELDRRVAVKVPRPERVTRPEDIDAYLSEARTLARLDHPNIVPVYDLGRTAGGLCYVVSKYVEGCDLRQRMQSWPLSLAESARLVADVAEAADHAHRHRLIHCDIKPANILIDRAGKPFLADFGLTLKEEDFAGAAPAGTPNYMSPEQTRGEGHRIDGRSDVFSLGCVLYELCTRRRPFAGATASAVLENIRTCDPTPPRQWNEGVPEELERICLKALSKRAADRYATAREMAGDLRHFALAPAAAAPAPAGPFPEDGGASPLPAVIPRGLRSFDRDDADFFPALLPGPRDRHGLPDTLRFWKTRVESLDPDETFRVGLLYGPSGCGKSSLVKAGLLPRLGRHVRPVYVEATPSVTETDLLRALLRGCPELPPDSGLVNALAAVRRGRLLPAGQKVLLVLDQFEQWLASRSDGANAALVAALRQCDGARLQAVVLVRDDFWMAVTRFMAALEVRIVEGENSAAVDLFTTAHARSVLKSFGRAYGALPASDAALTREQNLFLDLTVAELAQDWKVIPVRLVLFAEMVKARPWVPATLKAVGGMQGVGVAFLDEAFSAPTSPPGRRAHRTAAEAVLNLLLPEAGTTIKGRSHSEAELRVASGYAERPADFNDLIHVLDGELRLITPADSPAAVAEPGAPGGRCYQLTHDFLVQSVRDWVSRGKQQTRGGRAALRLAERTAFWTVNLENRYLPSLAEWVSILLFTRRGRWSEAERRIMRRASWVNGLVLSGAVTALAVLAAAGVAIAGAMHVRSLVPNLLVAELDHVPESVTAMENFHWWTDRELRRVLADNPDGSDRKLRASLALLPVDPSQREYLGEQLRQASPDQLFVLRDALRRHSGVLAPRLRDSLRGAADDDPAVLPTAAALADYLPDDDVLWGEVSAKVARALARADFVSLKRWLDALRPVRRHLKAPLAALYREDPRSEKSSKVADILSDYASDDVGLAADLLLDAEPAHFGPLFDIAGRNAQQAAPVWRAELARVVPDAPADRAEPARDLLAARQARAAIALLRVGADAEAVWGYLRHSTDPRARGFVLDLLRPMGIDRAAVADRLRTLPPGPGGAGRRPGEILFDPVVSTRRALILALGTYDPPAPPAGGPEPLIAALLALYANDPDAGVHAAAEWTLRRWHQGAALAAADARPRGAARGERRWYVSPQGLTWSVIEPPGEFVVGSLPGEPWLRVHESAHRRVVGRRYAVAAKEVSVAQFEAFLKEDNDPERRRRFAAEPAGADPTCPRNNLSWFDAAALCNWLSAQEGLTPCYLPNKAGLYGPGMSIKPDALELSGYRLPTEAEWEYAARAGAATCRYYGNSDRLLARYAWTEGSSGNRTHPCGVLLPNDLGLFDTLGNLIEWTQNEAGNYPGADARPTPDVLEGAAEIDANKPRVLRGGSFLSHEDDVRVMRRDRTEPGEWHTTYGVRPVRTVP